ncbi:MAG: hypothetical protein K9W44_09010 [Candidatus Lokiarchaeota archaeon]|nr:hypothetical protein [Candidatus Harpocratesius repetitus]
MLSQLPEILITIGWILLLIFITIALAVISLSIGINAVKGEHTEFGAVFITGLIAVFLAGVISFVFQLLLPGWALIGTLISLLVSMFVIMNRHETTFFGALGAILIYAIVFTIILIVLFLFTPSIVTWISTILNYDITQLIPSI